MTPYELSWLAGLLEGEGSFDTQSRASEKRHDRPRIQFGSTDFDICERVAQLFNKKVNGPYKAYKNQKAIKPYCRVLISGPRAADLMKLLYPLLGKRRKLQIRTALMRWKVL